MAIFVVDCPFCDSRMVTGLIIARSINDVRALLLAFRPFSPESEIDSSIMLFVKNTIAKRDFSKGFNKQGGRLMNSP